MRTQKVNSENVDQKLFETFRKLGYDGTSMEILAQATGLKKASLYHRFPKGKKEMALHVLNIVEHWIDENIVSVSSNNKIKPETRLKKMITAIDELYNGGANNCLLRTLSIGTDADAFKDSVHRCFDLLADGFATVSINLGNSPANAKEKGENLNLLLQGSLVIAGATGDVSYFKNLLSKLPSLLAK
jgi:AcrR family transcriptional regulator